MTSMPQGRQIKAARILCGLTAHALARAAHVNPSTISRLEKSGVSAVSGRVYASVLQALENKGVVIEGDVLRMTKKPRR
jgi:transcriptional regulator with XRE-family HTH domain